VKYAWIDEQCRHYPLSALCEVLSVSINGYRAWRRGGTAERKRLTAAQLLTLIRSIHAELRATAIPKEQSGAAEAMRAVSVARRSAVKARRPLSLARAHATVEGSILAGGSHWLLERAVRTARNINANQRIGAPPVTAIVAPEM
jgi:pyruvate-formate lyase-activating enzyme